MKKNKNVIAAHHSSLSAFTLVELAVVIMIIAVITGMAITSGVTAVSSARLSATNQKMAVIDQSLLAYRIANDRLPCPSSLTLPQGNVNYGVEADGDSSSAVAAGSGKCTGGTPAAYKDYTVSNAQLVAEGGVPTATLGLPSDFMYDGWGQRIVYAVDATMTQTGAFSSTQVGAATGAITVLAGPAYPATATRSTNAIYVLLSHGPNKHGGFSSSGTAYNGGITNLDEQVNCHCDNTGASTAYPDSSHSTVPTYVQEPPTTQDTTTALKNFDDIVIYKERWQMQVPWDAPGAARGTVWVADGGNNRIQQLNKMPVWIKTYTTAPTALSAPAGVAVDKFGYMWVADTGYNSVWKLNSAGSGVSMGIGCNYQGIVSCLLGVAASSNGTFSSPSDVAIDSNMNIWVSDTNNHRLQKFDYNGNWILSVGYPTSCETAPSGTVPGCNAEYHISGGVGFYSPYGIAVDASNNVWVADTSNNRVVELDPGGNFIQAIGCNANPYANQHTTPGSAACDTGTGNYQFNTPKDVTIDQDGHVWVVEAAGNNRVMEFSNSGTYITSFTSSFSSAMGIKADSSGYLWIADRGNNVIKKCTTAGSCTSYGAAGAGNGQFSSASGFGLFVTGR